MEADIAGDETACERVCCPRAEKMFAQFLQLSAGLALADKASSTVFTYHINYAGQAFRLWISINIRLVENYSEYWE